jgi:hypothetical protein
MIDTGVWDTLCRNELARSLEDNRAFDSFSLMLFGANFHTDKAALDSMYDYEAYINKAQQRVASGGDRLHETVRTALRKAIERF